MDITNWLGNLLFNTIIKKYGVELDKNVEEFKSNLNRKDFVSKTRFETEFSIYRELNGVFFDLVYAINQIIPAGVEWKLPDQQKQNELEKERFSDAIAIYANARKSLAYNSAFIPEQFYDNYQQILRLCGKQISAVSQKYNVLNFSSDKGKPKLEDYFRTDKINELIENNSREIRNYLESLEAYDI